MGAAEDWQRELIQYLAKKPYAGILDLYNPRRDDWDPSWPNDPEHSEFNGQVTWEIKRQMEADFILYYFAADTISAITLFELALFKDKNPLVGIDPAYKRIGNLLVTNDVLASEGEKPMDMHVGWNGFIKALDARLDPLGYAKMPRIEPLQPVTP